jgi:hypothetical protein
LPDLSDRLTALAMALDQFRSLRSPAQRANICPLVTHVLLTTVNGELRAGQRLERLRLGRDYLRWLQSGSLSFKLVGIVAHPPCRLLIQYSGRK